MAENENLLKKSEDLTKPESALPSASFQAMKSFWDSLSPTGRDVVAITGVFGIMAAGVIAIKKGFSSDLKIGDRIRWTFGPSRSKDDFDDD